MKSISERQQFIEQLTEKLGKPIPESDSVIMEGAITWVWAIDFSTFEVFIDSEGKISLEIYNYPNAHSDPIMEDITVENVLQKAKDFA